METARNIIESPFLQPDTKRKFLVKSSCFNKKLNREVEHNSIVFAYDEEDAKGIFLRSPIGHREIIEVAMEDKLLPEITFGPYMR